MPFFFSGSNEKLVTDPAAGYLALGGEMRSALLGMSWAIFLEEG